MTAIERAYVIDALDRSWISGTGDYVGRFEAALAGRTGREYVIAVANGTMALELGLRALGIGPGDEVLVPAMTFAAPAMSVLAVGADVVLADIDPETWTIDPRDAARRVTRRTAAVIAVDLLGHPADYAALAELGVPVIQDSAEAHGAWYRGRPVGAQGVISIFSFHANKAVTTGEGGSAGTDDPRLAERMRLMTNHGMTVSRPYVHPELGRNFRSSNLSAAIGLGQVERWDELVAARAAISARYDVRLTGSGLRNPSTAKWAIRSTWLHTVCTPARDRVVSELQSLGVDARAVWPPLNQQPVLRRAALRAGPLPHADEAAACSMWLPTSAVMTHEDVDAVSACVVDVVRRAASAERE